MLFLRRSPSADAEAVHHGGVGRWHYFDYVEPGGHHIVRSVEQCIVLENSSHLLRSILSRHLRSTDEQQKIAKSKGGQLNRPY